MAEEMKNVENNVTEQMVEQKVEAPKADVKEKSVEKSAEDQLQEMRVEMLKLKKALDKSSSETASYKKQLRAKQTEDEIALQEKAEAELKREEEFNAMKKKIEISDLTENFMSLGYNKEMALKAANASYDNDREQLFKIQQEFMSAHDNNLKAEWQKSIPELQVGVGSNKTEDPFLMGFGM